MEDEKIIALFFGRSEDAIRELDHKYGEICHNLSFHIFIPINNRHGRRTFIRYTARVLFGKDYSTLLSD